MEYFLIRVSPERGVRKRLVASDDVEGAVAYAERAKEKNYDVLDEDTNLVWKVRGGVQQFP